MAATPSQMTKDELKGLIEATVERKLRDLLGDPDEGLALKKASERGSGDRNGLLPRASVANRSPR